MKKLCLIATGGTIASAPGVHGLCPALTGEQIVELTALGDGVSLDVLELLALDSTNVTPYDWQNVARAIAERRERYAGFIVTHGTDTMAYTAAALSKMLENIAVPVAVTGSQLPLPAAGTDAVQNLCAAVRVAESTRAGVCLVFGGKILSGISARKLYTENLCAFYSINQPTAGEFRGGRVHWLAPAAKRGAFVLHDEICCRVAVLKLTPGISPRLLRALVDAHYDVVIVEGFGAGGVPTIPIDGTSFLDALDYAREKGVKVIGTTQCTYDGACLSRYENGVLAKKHGMLSGGEKTTECLFAEAALGLL